MVDENYQVLVDWNREPKQVVGKTADYQWIYLAHIFVYLETGFGISLEERIENLVRIE